MSPAPDSTLPDAQQIIAELEKAHALCGVTSGGLIQIEVDRYRLLAVRGKTSFAEY